MVFKHQKLLCKHQYQTPLDFKCQKIFLKPPTFALLTRPSSSNVSPTQVPKTPSNVSTFTQQQSSRFDQPIRSHYLRRPFFMIELEFESKLDHQKIIQKYLPNNSHFFPSDLKKKKKIMSLAYLTETLKSLSTT